MYSGQARIGFTIMTIQDPNEPSERLPFTDVAFIERVVQYQDGQMSKAQILDFENELSADQFKQTLFVELQLNAATVRHLLERDAFEAPVALAQNTKRVSPDRRFWSRIGLGAMAASVLAMFAFWQIYNLREKSSSSEPSTPVDVRFTGISQAQFLGQFAPKLGSHVNPNHDYMLTNGLVELRFQSGATTIIEGPALFRVSSSDCLAIDLGKCSVHAPKGAEGFRIETPTNSIVDRGTRFSVSISETSDTEVHVVEGMAEVYPSIRDSNNTKSTELAMQASTKLGESEARRFVSTDTRSIEAIEFLGGQYRRALPDRIVSYEATSGPEGNAQDLISLTLQRNGKQITYQTDELIPSRLTYFKSEAPNSIGHLISANELPASRASLLSDSSLNTGIINPGGQSIPLASPPLLIVDETNKSGTPGFAIRFANPVSNCLGPDVVFFEIQTVSNPIAGDAFHVSPLVFRDGLKSTTMREYDLQFNSPAALKIDRFSIFRFADSISSLSRLESASCTKTAMRLGFRALAVGIDLSDLGYKIDERVDGLFFQDAHDDEDCVVDPVFIAGLPE
jgi:FecR protein